MSKKTDVLVIGSGLAGLMAALAAARKNVKVSVIYNGMGCLAIGGGNIDLLGYHDKQRVSDPCSTIDNLPSSHPLAKLGKDSVKNAIKELMASASSHGLDLKYSMNSEGRPQNTLFPTILGTLKPVFLYDAVYNMDALVKAKKILVAGIEGYRDFKPGLISEQLGRYDIFKDTKFDLMTLPAPFNERGRSISALDLAHLMDRTAGENLLANNLKEIGKNYDLALVPPIFGARSDSSCRKNAESMIGCPFIELLSVPPAVTGLRLRDALMRSLHELDVEFIENAEAVLPKVQDGVCTSIIARSTGRDVEHIAAAIVVATGGIISGGLILGQGTATESVFGIDVPVPADVDEWSSPDILESHLVNNIGVTVDSSMRPVDLGDRVILQNVFFAGRIIGDYDYAAEKSGNGVAAATGWQAGTMAAELVNASRGTN